MADNRCRALGRSVLARLGPLPLMVAVLSVLVCGGNESRADRITLRGGGQIRGKLLPDPAHAERVLILTESGKTPLSFQKAQVTQVAPEPSALDEYLVRRDKLTASAEADYALGVWCDEHKLKDLAELHFEAAVKHDASYEPAHQKLGHVRLGDHWVWGDELREAQGLVRYKGQWMSKQEKDRRAAAAANKAEQAAWVRRLKLLRQTVLYGNEERRRDAEQQLMAIRDPIAVSPLLQVFGNESGLLRTLLDHVLEQIPGPEAAVGLVTHILCEPDVDVRHVTINALSKRKETNVVPTLVQALGSKDPAVVNRAAWTLGQLGAVHTVPKLIPALITVQFRFVMPPVQGWSSGSPGTSFGSIPPSAALAGSYFNSVDSSGLLSQPSLGPGMPGYPVGAIPGPGLPSATFSSGGGGPREQLPRIVPLRFQNVEVLATLVKLTGQDFGFDIPAWQRWVSSGYHPDPAPARRVPQP